MMDTIARTTAALALVVLAAFLAWTYPARSAEMAIGPGDVVVVDGDTIHLRGREENTRLIGFNAPESEKRRAMCEAERNLGIKASARLEAIVAAGRLTFEDVQCSCRPGTHGTRACNNGRSCGTLRASGMDVGEMLIGEGLAVPFTCGATRCPKLPQPWCS